MGLNDWLIALHLLSAFALAAAIVLFWVVIVVVRRTDLPEQVASAARLLPVGSVTVAAGSIGVIVFGIWLAIALDEVKVWDGWVLAAIVLWAISTEAGRRADPVPEPVDEPEAHHHREHEPTADERNRGAHRPEQQRDLGGPVTAHRRRPQYRRRDRSAHEQEAAGEMQEQDRVVAHRRRR